VPVVPKNLTEAQIRKLPEGRTRVAEGLYVRVVPTATGLQRSFYEARVTAPNGRPTYRRLGSTALALSEAKRLAASLDAEAKKPPTQRRFEEAARDYWATHSPGWGESYGKQFIRSLELYVFKSLGDIPCDRITSKSIADCVKADWHKPSVRRVPSRIESILLAEIARTGADFKNVADEKILRHLVPKTKEIEGHYIAPTVPQLRAFIRGLNDQDLGDRIFRVLAYTAVRSSEARLADWSEIDIDAKLWVIPAQRTKMNRPHVVPLTESALKAFGPPGQGYVFKFRGDVVGAGVVPALFRRKAPGFHIHGLRACFRTWAQESEIAFEVAESILGHLERSRTVRAYARSDLVEQKRAVLEKWSAALNVDE